MLNREKRRKFAKEAKAKGIPKEYIDAYLTMLASKSDGDLIEDGMKVVVSATPKLTQWGKFSLTVKAIRPSGEGS